MAAVRPVLIGMNNPIHPRRPLWPSPAGCTGHRVLALLQRQRPDVTEEQYLEAFDRRNLLYEREWDKDKAVRGAERLIKELRNTRRKILVLGETARKLLEIPERARLTEGWWYGCAWRAIPHPSGRCHWYNEDFCRDVVALILQQMYEEYADAARASS